MAPDERSEGPSPASNWTMVLFIGAAVVVMGAGLFLFRLMEVQRVRQKVGLDIANPGSNRLRIAYNVDGVKTSFETTSSTNLSFNPHTFSLTLEKVSGLSPVEVVGWFGGYRHRHASVWSGTPAISLELATTVDWPKFWRVAEYDATAVAKKSLHGRGLPPPTP